MRVGKSCRQTHSELNEYLTTKNTSVIEGDIRRYARANYFLRKLNKYTDRLTIQEYKQIRELALAGETHGANDMLYEILDGKTVVG